jgi:excisionase family DNA binding protein
MPTQTQEVDPLSVSPERVAVSASPIRFAIPEAAELLRMSRAQLYNRINNGAIKPHKDGARTYISRWELERYVDSCR